MLWNLIYLSFIKKEGWMIETEQIYENFDRSLYPMSVIELKRLFPKVQLIKDKDFIVVEQRDVKPVAKPR